MATSDRVLLRGGLTVSAAALRLLWQLEDDGFTAERLADGRLRISPPGRLTPELAWAIRQWRDELLQLVQYVADDSHLFTDDAPSPESAWRTA